MKLEIREVHTKKSREGARYRGYRRERLNEVSRYTKLQKYWAYGYVSYRATWIRGRAKNEGSDKIMAGSIRS